MTVHDPVAVGLLVFALLCFVVIVGIVGLALCAAAAYGDEIAQAAQDDPQAAAALEEFGDSASAVVFDFPRRAA
jgi:hypothetical protein